jgi:phosphopantetheinyl transferase (holo-ACP synthase)
MRVGDDVVDLDDPFIAASHRRPRFVERVCCESERAMLGASSDPKTLLWQLFAAKEAAFKIVAKTGPQPPFAHRRFVVMPDLRSVSYDGLAFDLRVAVEGACVHAIAWTGAGTPLAGHGLVETGSTPGDEARRRLCEAVARGLGCGRECLAVVRAPAPGSWDGFGPPVLLRDGRPSGVDVSLTHDGRFVGFAAGVGVGVAGGVAVAVAGGVAGGVGVGVASGVVDVDVMPDGVGRGTS